MAVENKTCLYTACFLDGEDDSGSSRIKRNIRYVEYYSKLTHELGFTDFIFCDNASSNKNISEFLLKAQKFLVDEQKLIFHLNGIHYERKGLSMPYAWRAFFYLREIIKKGYDKIICIDSDGFIVSARLAEYVKNLNKGWECFFDQVHSFPTAEFHVINRDAFKHILDFTSGTEEDFIKKWDKRVMELHLPFLSINTKFKVGRFGEKNLEQSKDIDFYGQASLSTRLEFNDRQTI